MTIKWFKSPYNWVISPLTQPQVANQQQKKTNKCDLLIRLGRGAHIIYGGSVGILLSISEIPLVSFSTILLFWVFLDPYSSFNNSFNCIVIIAFKPFFVAYPFLDRHDDYIGGVCYSDALV